MTPFIPKSIIIAASRRDPVKRQENERHMDRLALIIAAVAVALLAFGVWALVSL